MQTSTSLSLQCEALQTPAKAQEAAKAMVLDGPIAAQELHSEQASLGQQGTAEPMAEGEHTDPQAAASAPVQEQAGAPAVVDTSAAHHASEEAFPDAAAAFQGRAQEQA